MWSQRAARLGMARHGAAGLELEQGAQSATGQEGQANVEPETGRAGHGRA